MKLELWTWIAAVLSLSAGCAPDTTTPAVPMITQFREEPWDGSGGGVQLTSEHYRIYTTVTRANMLRYLPGFMEACHRNYLRITGLEARPAAEKMPVYMMGSRGEWVSLTRHTLGARAGPYLGIEAGGYCYRGVCVFWDTGGIGSLSIAAHEGLHQFLHHRMRNRLPMWAEEGLCTMAEGYHVEHDAVTFTPRHNVARGNNLRESIVQDRTIPLPRLLEMDSGDAVTKDTQYAVGYYGQLWALAVYIQSVPAYRAGMDRLLADAEGGRFHLALKVPAKDLDRLRRRGRIYNRSISRPLFEHYISRDLETFEKQYRAFAKRLAELN